MKKSYTKLQLKRRARSYAGGNVQNLEFPHDGFEDVDPEDWGTVMEEFERIAQKLYVSAGIKDYFVKE